MTKRFKYILDWCHARGVHHYLTFFKACSPDQSIYGAHYARIRYVYQAGAAFVTEADEPWIKDMEDTIYAINERILTEQKYTKANEQLK